MLRSSHSRQLLRSNTQLLGVSRTLRQLQWSRWNSTLAEEVVAEETTKPAESSKPRKPLAPLPSYLTYITSGRLSVIPAEDYLRTVENAVVRETNSEHFDAAKQTVLLNPSFHRVMRFLGQTYTEESTATMNYKLLSILKEHHLANISHFDRVMTSYLKESKPDDAMSVYVESLEYAKSVDDVAFMKANNPEDIYSTLYVSYLLSCSKSDSKPDIETYRAISGISEFKVNSQQVRMILGRMGAKSEFYEFVLKNLRKDRLKLSDPNDPQLTERGLLAAYNLQTATLEAAYQNIVSIAKATGSPITEETYRKIMHMFSVGNMPKKAQSIWNDLNEKVEGEKSLESWNELLFSFSKLKSKKDSEEAKENMSKLDTVFKYIDENYTINSDTMKYLISGYISNEEFEKAFQLVRDLSTKGRKGLKLDDSITSAYLLGLVQSNKLSESLNLMDSFLKTGFKPEIRFLNTILAQLSKKKDFVKCDEIVEIIRSRNIKPDIATYTLLIDILLKNTAQATTVSLDNLLSAIIQEMKSNGFNFSNPVTLSAIVDGLAKEGSIESAKLLVDYMKQNKIKLPLQLCTSIIEAASRFGDLGFAKQIFKESVDQGVRLNTPYYNTIINGCLKAGSLADALVYYQRLKESKNIRFNFYTYYFLLRDVLTKHFDKAIAESLIADLSELVLKDNISLGRGLPGILKALEKRSITMPEPLLSKIHN